MAPSPSRPPSTRSGPGPSGWREPLPLSPLEAEVAQQLRPSSAELGRLAQAREELVALAVRRAEERGVPLKRALVAGSAARETYLPPGRGGRLDLDLFLLFDPSLPRDRLASEGLELASALLEGPEKRYAEHPYLRGRFGEFEVDAVPGYQVARSDQPQTAVDRTPFHHEYLQARLTPERKDDVRLLKRFLRTLGIYGADARTAGCSGYLVELLVLHGGSFGGLLQEARSWRVPQRLCPPGPEPAVTDDVALVLPDPVDPHRNVASALSRANLALFLLGVREYLARPRREFFDPPVPSSPVWSELLAQGRARGTHVVVLTFPAPDLVDDILYPQLRKCERALAGPLQRWGFHLLGSASAVANGRAAVVVEVDRTELAPTALHAGPPAGSKEVASYLEKWSTASPTRRRGPYVTAEGHLQVDVARGTRDASSLLRKELPQMGFGRSLQEVVARQGELRPLEEVAEAPHVREALALLWRAGLPWAEWP